MQGQIDGGVAKERSGIMTDIFHNVARMNNEKWISWEGEVLIDEIGKNNTFVGRNFAYRPVIVSGNFKIGDIIKVKITNVTSFDLRGEAL